MAVHLLPPHTQGTADRWMDRRKNKEIQERAKTNNKKKLLRQNNTEKKLLTKNNKEKKLTTKKRKRENITKLGFKKLCTRNKKKSELAPDQKPGSAEESNLRLFSALSNLRNKLLTQNDNKNIISPGKT